MTQAVVAFIGTGLMGAPMARNLLKHRFTVRAWNRTPAKAQALEGEGAQIVSSPEEAAKGAEFVITMLSNGTATGAMVARIGSVLAPGSSWLDMSSTRPGEARSQAEALDRLGHPHLDAPVSGGTRGAEAGSLAIMVGGEAVAFSRAKPVFEAMGRPVHVGPAGSGQLAKLANQAIVGISIGAVAEAMLLLEAGGADPAAVRMALRGGFADSTILQQHGQRMTERDFHPGGHSSNQLKDLENVLLEARSLGLQLPLSEEIRNRYAFFCDEMSGSEKDHSGLYLELRRRNGLEELS